MTSNERAIGMGVFYSREEAEAALKALQDIDFPMDQVSVVAREADRIDDAEMGGANTTDRIGNKDVSNATGIVGNIITAGGLGTVMLGLTSIAIPGIGFVLAAGSLGGTLAATIVGFGMETASFEGLVRAFQEVGIPEAEARVYSDRLFHDDYVVMVDTMPEYIEHAKEVFQQHHIRHWGIFPISPM